MRVGSDYQATVPHVSTVLEKPASQSTAENAVLIWSPVNNIPEEKRTHFTICTDYFFPNFEQECNEFLIAKTIRSG
jgi:hypothetical protein